RHPVALPRQPDPRGEHPRHLDPHPAQQAERVRGGGHGHSRPAERRRRLRLRGLTMSFRMDRRSVLTGLTALGLSGCEVPATDAPAPARPAPPAPAPAMRALDLSALERAHGGRLGVAIMTPAGDEVFAWRGGERFLYCSTFK